MRQVEDVWDEDSAYLEMLAKEVFYLFYFLMCFLVFNLNF